MRGGENTMGLPNAIDVDAPGAVPDSVRSDSVRNSTGYSTRPELPPVRSSPSIPLGTASNRGVTTVDSRLRILNAPTPNRMPSLSDEETPQNPHLDSTPSPLKSENTVQGQTGFINSSSDSIDTHGPEALMRQQALQSLIDKMNGLQPNEYGLTVADLGRLVSFDNRTSPAQVDLLNDEFGGVEGVAILLRTHITEGIGVRKEESTNKDSGKAGGKKGTGGANALKDVSDKKPPALEAADKDQRVELFGMNVIPPPRSLTIIEIVWETIKDDPIIKILIIGAVAVMALGTAICPAGGYVEGLAIVVAVVIVLSVTAGNDWSKDRKFKKLLLLQSDKSVKVIRGGHEDQMSSWDLLVGDVVEVVVGDEIPADGILIKSNRLVIDESPLTGESIPVKKSANAPFLFSGTQVSEGSGTFLVAAVGPRSSGGQIQELLNEAQGEETVLQLKLKVVAVLIGKVGVAAGILTFVGLTIRWAIDFANGSPTHGNTCATYSSAESSNMTLMRLQDLAENFVIGISIVVVAVPEGLPLAVTISLAFSMFKMIRDKCFVRHLDASETMGEATCICTDKTGTLTENRMTVVKAMVGDTIFHGEGSGEQDARPYSPTTFDKKTAALLGEGIAMNSTCFVKYGENEAVPTFVGSATEGALLVLMKKIGIDYGEVRKSVVKVDNGVWSFSSDRKRMSTLVQPSAVGPGQRKKYRLYTKGASEIVLGLCTHIVDPKCSTVAPIQSKTVARLQDVIKAWASEGLRTLALAYKDSDHQLTTIEGQGYRDDPEHDLVFLGFVGIKDPLRKEVAFAVERCQKAGIKIKMVTGDNILTACKIARESGILFDDGIAMEGPRFRDLSEEDKKKVAPRLQVLARSSPADKYTLVSLLKEMGEVVAVTGDGTNDAPALKEADVGFAMGMYGTQIAMNASDIILLDDNFASLVNSVKWGRNVLNSVRKFLQFQLGVNLVAIIITFIGSMIYGTSPLTTVQLLWVNLIMDSLGALALASDEPEDDILDQPPHARNEALISTRMWEFIGLQMAYQTTALLFILIHGMGDSHFLPHGQVPTDIDYETWAEKRTKTIVFTAFILMQISNETMARQLNGEINVFKGFFRNKLFLLIMVIIAGIQVLVVMFGQGFVQTVSLDWQGWVLCIAIALGNFPWMLLARGSLILVRRCIVRYRQRKVRQSTSEESLPFGGETANESRDEVFKFGASSNGLTKPSAGQHTLNKLGESKIALAKQPTEGGAKVVKSADWEETRKIKVGETPAHLSTHEDEAVVTVEEVQMFDRVGSSESTRARNRWQTLRAGVALIGHLQHIREPEQGQLAPSKSFVEVWRHFRVDHALPTKNATKTKSLRSLHD
ncbi:hypothetical protein BJ742DRAFT_881274 [Cladochytrium replicatum]|nr:hypothetical protein BJ742DRAFT_881274 [Cladochytrium replicatum]